MSEQPLRQAPKVYEAVRRLMYRTAARFYKKHGEWLVHYVPNRQVILMDTWNGAIYQAHVKDTLLVDDGYPDVQLHGRIHTVISGRDAELTDAVAMYKLLLREGA